jgi:hypothetical protein
MIPIILDNTKRSTFRQCKKKYLLQHLHGLQSNYGSTAIRYGVCWHGIQEGFYSWVKEHGWPTNPSDRMLAIAQALELGKKKFDKEASKKSYIDDYKNFNTAVNAFNAYLDFFADDSHYIEVIHTEKKFECPIEPENSAEEKMLSKLPPVVFTGKIDLGVKMDSQNWIQDFKTTGWILDQVISKANRSPQFIGYSYAGKKCLDFEPNGCLASFHQVGAYKSKKTGEYGDAKFEFRRVPQIYTEKDIAAWKLSFIDTAKDIFDALERDLWPESFDNCFQYGQCQYLKLCQQHTDFDKLNLEGFHEDFWSVLDDD